MIAPSDNSPVRGASQAMLISTSSFTKVAHEFERGHRCELAPGGYDDLVRWIRQYRLRRNWP